MKGNDRMLTVLNELLADELTAISQYMVHSEMCSHWGYSTLHGAIEKQAVDEMHHAEWLIERILLLEGKPVVTKLNPMKVAGDVPGMIGSDQEAELGAVQAYNAGIRLARDLDDNASAQLLTEILKMEEGHVDWAEKQRAQIAQMGLESYLPLSLPPLPGAASRPGLSSAAAEARSDPARRSQTRRPAPSRLLCYS
jgi:bacterioferritin